MLENLDTDNHKEVDQILLSDQKWVSLAKNQRYILPAKSQNAIVTISIQIALLRIFSSFLESF